MAIRRCYTVGGPWLPGPHPREISFQIWQFIHPYLLIPISQMASTIQAIQTDIERGGKFRRFDNVSGDVTNNLLLLTPQMDFAVAISYIPSAFWSFLIFHWADWKWATFLLLVYIRSKSGGSNRSEINHPKLHIIRIIATLGTYKMLPIITSFVVWIYKKVSHRWQAARGIYANTVVWLPPPENMSVVLGQTVWALIRVPKIGACWSPDPLWWGRS